MAFPVPEPGLVISYAYLWRHEHEAGLEEGRKTRPCVIVLAVETKNDTTLVTVAPITRSTPSGNIVGIVLPPRIKQHLALDHERSWVIISEVNQFVWPGYDVRPTPGSKHNFAHGFLPPNLFEKIKSTLLELLLKRRADITSRD